MSNERTYIGTGRQQQGSYTIDLVLDMNALLNAPTIERDGRTYLKCRVVKRLKTSQWGHTHSVYIPEGERDRNEILLDRQEEQ